MKRFACILVLIFTSGFIILKSQDTQNNYVSEKVNSLEKDTTLIVERMATFQSGHWMQFRNWVESHLIYPESAARKGIQGKVVVRFSVSTKGKIEKVKIVRGPHRLLNKEVLRVVKSSPDWEPAMQEGRYVIQQFYMPIIFNF